MVTLFALTMFISATLLFIVQPMVAKLLLPSLGGSAAVWTTCMLFFQATLLLGYGYAHLGARYFSPRRQALAHLPLMLLALLVLPFSIPELGLTPSASPNSWLLAALVLSIGLPFFIVSSTAPLLQHFFAHVDHRDADDPYFLYGASNLGSMVALVGYPTIVEPLLGVTRQTHLWALVYVVYVVLLAACARAVMGRRERSARAEAEAVAITWRQRFRWIVLAAVPSSLMLGVTQHITTDVAPAPLLWVLPLALYLATFVLVFSRRPLRLPDLARVVLPIGALVVFAATRLTSGPTVVALHLLNFFAFTLFFHGTLAAERPHVSRLTEYFLLLSIGGVAGGLFNALLAPVVFDQPVEYHVVMFVAVAAIAPHDISRGRSRWWVAAATGLAACLYLHAAAIISIVQWYLFFVYFALITALTGFVPRWRNVVVAGVLAVGAWTQFSAHALLYERSFFAAYKIYDDEANGQTFRSFRHGTTLHGVQATDPDEARIPRSYHHPDGPVGAVLSAVEHDSVLVIGLGAGAMAAYAQPGQRFDFYEIDPLVVELATEWFTYLSTCGDRCSVAVGDGRRLLTQSQNTYDIIVLDAYNSSGVPTHLLTREALQLYLAHLNEGGVLLFNVSNRFLNVEEVVGALCEDAGIPALERSFDPPWRQVWAERVHDSQFIVAAPEPAALAPFAAQPEVWKQPDQTDAVWTDDFSNVLGVVRW